MTGLSTDDLDAFFVEMMKDSSYKALYNEEKDKLVSAIAVSEARKKAGLSQQKLADKAGLPKTTIARIERGNNTSIETLSKIASALGKQVQLSIS